MRTPWLLASIFFHSAAVAVALLVGVCGPAFVRPPVARIEIRNAPPSAPARAELRATPEVEAEEEAAAQPLVELDVPPVERPEPEPVIDAAPLPPTASSVLAKVSSERVRAPKPPVEPPAEPATEALPEPVAEPLPVAPSQPAFTAATRSDQGGPPLYPEKLRLRGREGTVVLRVSVLADGSVADVSLKEPSRYAGFNRAALRAARGWRFEPATEAGVPVDSDTDVEVVFSLTESAGGRR